MDAFSLAYQQHKETLAKNVVLEKKVSDLEARLKEAEAKNTQLKEENRKLTVNKETLKQQLNSFTGAKIDEEIVKASNDIARSKETIELAQAKLNLLISSLRGTTDVSYANEISSNSNQTISNTNQNVQNINQKEVDLSKSSAQQQVSAPGSSGVLPKRIPLFKGFGRSAASIKLIPLLNPVNTPVYDGKGNGASQKVTRPDNDDTELISEDDTAANNGGSKIQGDKVVENVENGNKDSSGKQSANEIDVEATVDGTTSPSYTSKGTIGKGLLDRIFVDDESEESDTNREKETAGENNTGDKPVAKEKEDIVSPDRETEAIVPDQKEQPTTGEEQNNIENGHDQNNINQNKNENNIQSERESPLVNESPEINTDNMTNDKQNSSVQSGSENNMDTVEHQESEQERQHNTGLPISATNKDTSASEQVVQSFSSLVGESNIESSQYSEGARIGGTIGESVISQSLVHSTIESPAPPPVSKSNFLDKYQQYHRKELISRKNLPSLADADTDNEASNRSSGAPKRKKLRQDNNSITVRVTTENNQRAYYLVRKTVQLYKIMINLSKKYGVPVSLIRISLPGASPTEVIAPDAVVSEFPTNSKNELDIRVKFVSNELELVEGCYFRS